MATTDESPPIAVKHFGGPVTFTVIHVYPSIQRWLYQTHQPADVKRTVAIKWVVTLEFIQLVEHVSVQDAVQFSQNYIVWSGCRNETRIFAEIDERAAYLAWSTKLQAIGNVRGIPARQPTHQ